MDATKPYKFIGFGAMDATKPYKFIRFGAMDATKPYKFIGFAAALAAKPVRTDPNPVTSRPRKPGPGSTICGGPLDGIFNRFLIGFNRFE